MTEHSIDANTTGNAATALKTAGRISVTSTPSTTVGGLTTISSPTYTTGRNITVEVQVNSTNATRAGAMPATNYSYVAARLKTSKSGVDCDFVLPGWTARIRGLCILKSSGARNPTSATAFCRSQRYAYLATIDELRYLRSTETLGDGNWISSDYIIITYPNVIPAQLFWNASVMLITKYRI